MQATNEHSAASSASRAVAASLITACWSTQVIHVAVNMSVPDRLAAGIRTSVELASLAGAHPRAMFRLLRALAALGLCAQVGDDRFELTEAGQYLRTDVPQSLAILARHWGGRAWPALSQMEDSLKTGAAWSLGGREGFYSMAERPQDAAVLNGSMASQTLQVARAIVEAYDFSQFRRVTDLGGGYGALLSVLLEAYPQMEGASADLAYMEADALAFLQAAGVAKRSRFIPTDFFKSVEAGADCYLLKFIIHDWNDSDSIEILRNTGIAAGRNGKVLVVEQIAPRLVAATPQDATVIRGDIHMMVATGGMERTAEEYQSLLARAGLELQRIIPTASQFCLIESVPVG